MTVKTGQREAVDMADGGGSLTSSHGVDRSLVVGSWDAGAADSGRPQRSLQGVR